MLFFLFFGLNLFNSQIFSWKNPNISKENINTDSLISAKISQDFFKKDTLNFILNPKKRIIDDGVLVKNNRSKRFSELQAKGVFVRGISFGNNQGSAVQSTMDMKIEGKLSKNVSISANIFDNNLPIQADGYTQTLEDFDRIYIQLNINNKDTLNAGHLDLTDTSTYFGKFQRRSLGLQYKTLFGKENKTFANISFGIARSEFHRIRFQGFEGNQGPYRLKGINNENLISIIPDSEQIFINGILMKRGENYDYTINYNTGEITFTNNRPIYKQDFITASYNYTNRNYTRFLASGNLQHKNEKLKLGINWFLESDNKNAPISLNINNKEREVLAIAGNDTNKMFAPSGKLTEYDPTKILYKIENTANTEYYEYSTNKNDILYEVAFTYMGTNKGDYILVNSINNGRIFKYIGKNLGDYSATRKIPAPLQTQIISANAEYLLKNGKIKMDFSLSNHDINLFSKIGNEENIGWAGRLFSEKKFLFKNWKNSLSIDYQHINKNFHILDRINSVEFSRDFNLQQEFSHRTQNRLIFDMKNNFKNGSYLNYQLNILNEKKFYSGIKNEINFKTNIAKTHTLLIISHLSTNSTVEKTNFIKGNLEFEKMSKKGIWSFGGNLEHNIKKLKQLNIPNTDSFSWREFFIQKKIRDSTNIKFTSKLYFRVNDSIQNNRLENFNKILGFVANYKIIQTQKSTLNLSAHYRKIFYNKNNITNENNHFVIGNLDYNQELFNKGLILNIHYELGNGQEIQRTFQYIKIKDGQGTYKWTDYNSDGIQQLDEFEIAEYQDLAQYIRIYTDNIRYLPSNKNALQIQLNLNLHLILNSENKFLKRWNANFSMASQNSYYKNNQIAVINPFQRGNEHILKNQSLMASLLFNSNEISGWNGNYLLSKTENIINANFSNDTSIKINHLVNIGYKINKNFRTSIENSFIENNYHSQLFQAKNYLLSIRKISPKIIYQFTEKTTSEISFGHTQKNRKDGTERLNATDVTATLQWNSPKTAIRGSFSFIKNNFYGNAFSLVGNQMLDGLKTGQNKVWNLDIQQRINSFINLNINYEGRTSDDKTIHIGNIQVRASF